MTMPKYKPHTLHDSTLCQAQLAQLERILNGHPLRFMEVCGTHTAALFRSGLRSMLPKNITHLTGPGCPVCVTHENEVLAFLALASQPHVIIATFGDLIRIPDNQGRSLKHLQAQGADIRIVYSPLDALKLAISEPHKKIIFLGVGFETTAPTVAATIIQAKTHNLQNFFVHVCHKLVPPALEALLVDPACSIDAFLLPGHVSTIIGMKPFAFVTDTWKKPAVIGGFEAADILDALCRMATQITQQHFFIENAYPRAVHSEGNPKARDIMNTVFTTTDTAWRGLGILPQSGLCLQNEYTHFDALTHFTIEVPKAAPSACRCGDVLRGIIQPPDCPLYGKACTPAQPIGPCMVSSEGACAAFFSYAML